MSEVVVSLKERRLERDGLKITFFKVVVKLGVLRDQYPGGLDSFLDNYPAASQNKGLLALTFANLTEVNAFVDAMSLTGIRQGEDLATANQVHGELVACSGIQFEAIDRPFNTGAYSAFPVWYASLSTKHSC